MTYVQGFLEGTFVCILSVITGEVMLLINLFMFVLLLLYTIITTAAAASFCIHLVLTSLLAVLAAWYNVNQEVELV